MDYEKKYKQLHTFISDLYPFMSEYCKEKVEGFFPELAGSDDERIRKALISVLKSDFENDTTIHDISVGDIIAWLEKQESVDEIVGRCKTSWYNEGKIAGQFEGLTNDEKYQQGWHDALEKQGGQKPVSMDYCTAFDEFMSHIPEKDPERSDSLYTYEDMESAIKFGIQFEKQSNGKMKIISREKGSINIPDDLWEDEQKPFEWNKADDVMFKELYDFLTYNKTVLQHDCDLYAHWLKSLKQRIGG